jgi:hypothetical protein
MDVPLPLAVEDLVPTLLSGIAYALVAMAIGRRSATAGRIAWTGTVLLVAGGLSRGGWKLLLAAGGPDMALVEAVLFPLLAAGFGLLATALWSVRGTQDRHPGTREVAIAISILAVCATLGLLVAGRGPGARPAELVLIAITTVGNTATSVLLVRAALAVRARWAAMAIVLNLVTVYVLAGLARVDTQSLQLQVLEQAVNTTSQALLLLAVLRLADAWNARGIAVGNADAGNADAAVAGPMGAPVMAAAAVEAGSDEERPRT